MRQLTVKQKNLLKKWVNASKPTKPWQVSHATAEIRAVDDLTDTQWQTLVSINDTEILYQEVNRFISDFRMSLIHN